MVPALARAIGIELDEVGISVCAIGGTHFAAYIKLSRALGIPWAVLTDGDPAIKVTGARRKHLLQQGGADPNAIFVGTTTFEHDIVIESDSNRSAIIKVLTALVDDVEGDAVTTMAAWEEQPPEVKEFLKIISTIGGKGRFAQRLASTQLDPPPHLSAALTYLLEL